MPYVLHPRSSSDGHVPPSSYSSTPSGITFSNERGPGAFAPLGALPRRGSATRQRKSLFHIVDDDNAGAGSPQNSPPSTPPEPVEDEPQEQPRIPFPSTAPLSPPLSPPANERVPTAPRIVRTGSNPIILSNGKPLKSSLKSSSSSSIPDDYPAAAQQNANRALHTRAQSMPSTPAFTPKNVHFQEDDRLATVRVFRATGRPRSVSTQNEDTETETEPEQPAFPFPFMAGASRLPASPLVPLMDIDPSPTKTSTIPSPSVSPYANVRLESITLPPSRPPVLRGTVLVRNLSYEKRVGVRFTLDEWTTVSEVIATYSTSLTAPHPMLPAASPLTVGDLVAPTVPGSAPQSNNWDRFAFTIRLEDYEARLADRTLLMAASFNAPGVGEWWDNNAGANYRVAFRARAPSPPASRKPSIAPFLAGAATALPPPPAAPRCVLPVPAAARPPPLVRSISTPTQSVTRTLGRLALKHYAAPAPPALSVSVPKPPTPEDSPTTSPLKVFGGQFATHIEEVKVETKKEAKVEAPVEQHVDEGFETGSEDEDERPKDPLPTPPPSTTTTRSPGLHLDLGAPQPRKASAILAARGPFSPTRSSPVPFASVLSTVAQSNTGAGRTGESRGDATYAALIREWCFAQGDAGVTTNTHGTTTTGSTFGAPGKQNMLWVGMGG